MDNTNQQHQTDRVGGMRDDIFVCLHCLLPVCINLMLMAVANIRPYIYASVSRPGSFMYTHLLGHNLTGCQQGLTSKFHIPDDSNPGLQQAACAYLFIKGLFRFQTRWNLPPDCQTLGLITVNFCLSRLCS